MKTLTKKIRCSMKIVLFSTMSIVIFILSCGKDRGDYENIGFSNQAFGGSVYDYLKSRPELFDSLIYVLDKVGYSDSVKNNSITLFAPTNESFSNVVKAFNLGMSKRGRRELYLKDMDVNFLDSLLSSCIIRGSYVADSMMNTEGKLMRSIDFGFPMNGKLITTYASGLNGGGPGAIDFHYTQRSEFRSRWIKTRAEAINIKAENGIIHILEKTHPFGFGDYTKPRPEPYAHSIFRPSGTETPFLFPLQTGERIIIQAEDFDEGGQGVGYFDDNTTQSGGNYRPKEFIDIDKPHPAYTTSYGNFESTYSIGWTVAGSWANYSIEVPADGYYRIVANVGNGSAVNPLRFMLSIDNIDVTGPMTFPNNRGWWNYISVSSPVFYATKGRHNLKFHWLTNDIQFDCLIVIKE